MANIEIKETLDTIDKVSIVLYRIGMVVTGLALLFLALQQIFYPLWFQQALIFVALGALLQASSLHIYNKLVRWFLVSATWSGCWLVSVSLASNGLWGAYLSLGAFIITFSGLAYKESFCFSLPILKTIPLFLMLSWGLIILSLNQWVIVSLLPASLLYLYMAWRKINMPLYYDLGDRSKYEM